MENKVIRTWGHYRVIHEVPGMKVKELIVESGKNLSMQRHFKRSEYWIVSEGAAIVNSELVSGHAMPSKLLQKHDEYHVLKEEWHQLTNPFDVVLKIIEIQYGDECIEEDIERK